MLIICRTARYCARMKTVKNPQGSVLYRVYHDRRDGSPKEVTVTSVGREWIGVDDHRTKRFRKDTLTSSPS
jgi:hypothetical protein